MTPVPEAVITSASAVVSKSVLRSRRMPPNNARNSAERWPIIGRVISCRIAGRTHVGPGMKNLHSLM